MTPDSNCDIQGYWQILSRIATRTTVELVVMTDQVNASLKAFMVWLHKSHSVKEIVVEILLKWKLFTRSLMTPTLHSWPEKILTRRYMNMMNISLFDNIKLTNATIHRCQMHCIIALHATLWLKINGGKYVHVTRNHQETFAATKFQLICKTSHQCEQSLILNSSWTLLCFFTVRRRLQQCSRDV